MAKALGRGAIRPGRRVQEYGSGIREMMPGKALKTEQQEIERVEREFDRLTTERDILRKAVACYAREPS